jgi:hypothetical protein|tara:strand:+ start:157 stop:327 length:171 start_codon:yes stop_codon:yes gene_type:complete
MIINHTKSWNTEKTISRDGNPIHGFFMAKRRQTCPESKGNRIVISIENKKIKEITI